MAEVTFLDLFAGAGGLSEGFLRAGFRPIAHVEESIDACNTLKTRQGYYFHKAERSLEIYLKYLKGEIDRDDFHDTFEGHPSSAKIIRQRIDASNLKEIFSVIDNRRGRDSIDVIVGGPPCQAYSIIGRSRMGKHNITLDPRLILYKQYNKFISRYQPKIFVFENVLGLLSIDSGKLFNRIKRSFSRLGYYVEVLEVNSKDFGVLQNRKRLIIIGFSRRFFPSKDLVLNIYSSNTEKAKLKSLFRDLPAVSPGEQMHIVKYNSYYINKYLRSSGIRNGLNFTTQHYCRPHCQRDLDIYRFAIEKWNNERERIKYNNLPAELITHKNKTGFLDRFKVVAEDLEYSQTIVAHICKDGHYFIHPDIDQCRSITVREAARIQSFPDNYFFEGSRTAIFRQIGNAVPPLMSFGIAEGIKDFLYERI